MKFGLFTWFNPLKGRSHADSFAEAFKEVDAAEEMGWDSVWLPEAHYGGDVILLSSPFVAAASVAARTNRVKVGLAVHTAMSIAGGAGPGRVPLPPADPIRTAEDAAMVDQVSHGRFIYGVGGHSKGDEAKRLRFFEFLDVVQRAWTGEEFPGYEGKYYQYPKGLGITPKPYQKPHPPILLAVESTTSFPAVGKLGYHIAVGAGTSHNRRGYTVMKEDVKAYRTAWKEAGHPGDATIVVRAPTHVAETKERALFDVEETMRVAAERFGRRDLPQPDPGTSSVPTTEHANLFGTAEEVVERIYQFREELGADEIMFETNYFGAIPRERVMNSMRLITEKVIPKFK